MQLYIDLGMDKNPIRKTAFISHILPPSPSGQAVMLYRILSGVNPDNYYLISTREVLWQEKRGDGNSPFHLGGQYYLLPPEFSFTRPNRFGLSRMRILINIFIQIYTRTRNILGILHREPNTTAIIACTGDLADIPTAFLASRIAHIPFFAYIFDDYVFQWTGNYRLFAKLVAPIIFKHSTGIIGPNEFICDEYQRRYNVNSTLVRNPCDKNELGKDHYQEWPAEHGKIKIVYTGAVYHANLDCFRNLIQAMGSLSEYNLELHIFTAQTQEQLETQGIQSKQVFTHSHVSYSDILEQQHKADILFLPLAFESTIPEVIRTSAPGKMGEYLASGRPVFAHVPPNSFVAYYFRKYQCGSIVDQNEPRKLADEIEKLIVDHNLRSVITENAQRQARLDFSPELARSQLMMLLRKIQA